MKRIYIFPRYSGDENSDWYQKVRHEILLKDQGIQIIPLSFPNWDKPDIIEFLLTIDTILPPEEIDSETYFVGHSIGCKAALFYLDKLQKQNTLLKIGGLLCIAGWWTIDKPWLQLKPWLNHSVDYTKIQEICQNNIMTLLSNNDPFTSDTQGNKTLWKKNLKAEVIIIPEAKHFNNEGYDEIINNIVRLTSQKSDIQ